MKETFQSAQPWELVYALFIGIGVVALIALILYTTFHNFSKSKSKPIFGLDSEVDKTTWIIIPAIGIIVRDRKIIFAIAWLCVMGEVSIRYK